MGWTYLIYSFTSFSHPSRWLSVAIIWPCSPSVLVPVQRDTGQGRYCHRGLRGGAGHGKIWLLPQQQHYFSLERAQLGPWGHTGKGAFVAQSKYGSKLFVTPDIRCPTWAISTVCQDQILYNHEKNESNSHTVGSSLKSVEHLQSPFSLSRMSWRSCTPSWKSINGRRCSPTTRTCKRNAIPRKVSAAPWWNG